MWDVGRAYTKITSNISKVNEKRLAAGLRLDPLGELKRSLRPPSRSGGQGREHSLDEVRGVFRRGGWMEVHGRGGDE